MPTTKTISDSKPALSNDGRLDDVAELVENRLDDFLQSLDAKLAQFLGKVEREQSSTSIGLQEPDAATSPHENSSDLPESEIAESKPCEQKLAAAEKMVTAEKPMTAWERRKLAILAEYGVPEESEGQSEGASANPPVSPFKTTEPTDMEIAVTTKPKNGETYSGPERRKISRPLTETKDEALEALQESIESINIPDCEEVAALKESLTSKLREAEVELSINRAKLSQQWAALERRQFEVNQKESMLKCKYGNGDEESDTKPRLLDRISRHLSRSSNRTGRS